MRIAELSISFSGSVLLFLLFAVLCSLLGFLFYRFTLPPLPRGRRIVFSLVRAAALILLLAILFEPILRFVNRRDQKPVVALLFDNSQSMTIRDATGDRGVNIKKALNSGMLGHLSGDVQVKRFPFSSKLFTEWEEPADSIRFTGEVTNFSESFAGVKELLQRENIQAAVVLSDGNYTAGKNPLYDAENLGIPIYTVGVGDTNDQKDILIERVVSNTLAYTETQVPVDVTVRSSGYSGERVEVAIAEGGIVRDHQLITLSGGTREYALKMHLTPLEEGTKKYTISVSSLPNELTVRNNTRSLFVKVMKSKLRVVLMAGAPQTDVSAIRQVLREDDHVTIRSFVQKSGNTFYEGTLQKQVIDSADCVIFIGFPTAATGTATLQLIRDEMVQLKKPLLFINSKGTDYQRLAEFEPILPFTWSGPGTTEVLVGASIPEKEKHHSLVSLEDKISADDWQQLPPLYKTQTSFRAKPEAEVLAYAVLQNITLNEPLVAIRNIARQKSLAVTAEGLWRWRLMTQTNPRTALFLPLLIGNAVRWLTTREDERRIRVTPVKEIFTSAEPVEFTGQVYDEQLKAVDNAEITVQLELGAEKSQFTLTSIGSGLYEGSIDGVGEGDYSYTGKAVSNGRVLGEDKGKFSVGQVNVEFLETKMNKQLLEQIAFRTGGKYFDIENAQAIDNEMSMAMKFVSQEHIETSEIELWNWRYLGGILIMLFAAEWFMRKRSGML